MADIGVGCHTNKYCSPQKMERIYNGEIDDRAIHDWGYDEDLLFIDQDEDLLLGSPGYFPALSKLVKDSACPKSDYALSIIDFSLMFRVLGKDPDARSTILESIALLRDSDRSEVQRFIEINELRLRLLDGLTVDSAEAAEEIGRAALNGMARDAEITVVDRGKKWEIELSVQPFHRHKEWLTIRKSDGHYSFKR